MKEIISKIKAIIFGQNRASENLNQVPHSSPIIELSEEEKAILKLKLHEEENKRRQELKTELIEKYWNNVGESDTFGDYLKFMIKNLGNQFIEAPREEDQYKARRDEELLKKMTKKFQ
ncbi:MAG: hypothetical protein IPL42_05780 [Saprospiraceae bacterium]|nr:hypothetical protein [Saprospiraceae bacterium]